MIFVASPDGQIRIGGDHHGPLRVGIGGPVGSGKTALVEALCKRLRDDYDIYVITNDIYTKEDQLILTRAQALPAESAKKLLAALNALPGLASFAEKRAGRWRKG